MQDVSNKGFISYPSLNVSKALLIQPGLVINAT